MQVNINELATIIAINEGQQLNLDVTQIKQIINKALTEISKYENDEIIEFIERYRYLRKRS